MSKGMEEVNKWYSEAGLDDFKEEECVVNGMKRVDDNTLEIKAFVNIYLNNGDLYSSQIEFIVKKR